MRCSPSSASVNDAAGLRLPCQRASVVLKLLGASEVRRRARLAGEDQEAGSERRRAGGDQDRHAIHVGARIRKPGSDQLKGGLAGAV